MEHSCRHPEFMFMETHWWCPDCGWIHVLAPEAQMAAVVRAGLSDSTQEAE